MFSDGQHRVGLGLLVLRVGLGVFLLLWSIEKLVLPRAAVRVTQNFYGYAISESTAVVPGIAELALSLALLFGVARRWSYGLLFLIHTVSVASTWRQLLNPFGRNHLFIAGIPVLTAFITIYLMRESDIYSVDGWRQRQQP